MARQNGDPILSYRFMLELGFVQVAGFSECTGLSLETKVMEYREGGRNAGPLKFPDFGAVGNIILRRGIAPGPTVDALLKWQLDVMRGEFDETNNPNLRPAASDKDIGRRCAIVLQDSAGQEIQRWKLVRAMPVKWQGPDLKAMASDVAIETLELSCEALELA